MAQGGEWGTDDCIGLQLECVQPMFSTNTPGLLVLLLIARLTPRSRNGCSNVTMHSLDKGLLLAF
eukprot:SAG25_NODE_11910_length_292_cov_0.958549_1_plen_64_part_01